MKKIKVALLGGTGLVGQAFVSILTKHPFFDLTYIIASEKREGKNYLESVKWLLPVKPTSNLNNTKIEKFNIPNLKEKGIKIIFSALPSDVAKNIEKELKDEGFYIFSNSSAFRYKNNVPILIPEVNSEALELIKKQGFPHKGFIVTNANCSTTGLVMALAPLKELKIKKIFVSTYQAISGAGFPGLSAMEISGNLIPYIKDEEKKIIKETNKILNSNFEIYPTCVRVPVLFGHLETVWIKFGEKEISEENIVSLWQNFNNQNLSIPSFPEKTVVYSEEEAFPQPKLCFYGDPPGMSIFVGRLRKERDMYGFILLVNNLIRGAAGGSVLNAELFAKRYGETL